MRKLIFLLVISLLFLLSNIDINTASLYGVRYYFNFSSNYDSKNNNWAINNYLGSPLLASSPGLIGQSLDVQSGAMNLTNNNVFDLKTATVTFNFWFNRTSFTAGSQNIIRNLNDPASTQGYAIRYGASVLTVYRTCLELAGCAGIDIGNRNGRWVMSTIVKNNTGFTQYINGTNVCSCAHGGATSYNNTASNWNFTLSTLAGTAYVGYIDEMGWWDTQLNQSDITKLYNQGAGLSYTNLSKFGYTFETVTYSPSVYETEDINITLAGLFETPLYSSVAGYITYDNLIFPATLQTNENNYEVKTTINVPSISIKTNKSFIFTLSLTNTTGTYYFNTSWYNQTIEPVTLSRCNATNNVTYINFTYKSESTESFINASVDLATWYYYLGNGTYTKSLSYTNITEVLNHNFCFYPGHKTLKQVLLYQFSSTGYPQRQYYFTDSLTNSTTNKILYLLSSADGIYTSFQVITQAGNPISGATVQSYRQFSGVTTLISQGTTDSSGLATFWLNPNYDHSIIVYKTGYSTSTTTIRPTQSLYTIFLSQTNGSTLYSQPIKGITYTRTPNGGILSPGTHTFTFNISASGSNMQLCKFELVYSNGTTLDSTSSACTSNAYLTLTETLNVGDHIFGRYYVDVGSGYVLLEGDGEWWALTLNQSSWSIKSFLRMFQNYSFIDDGATIDEQKQYEFTKFVVLFMVIAIFAAGLNIQTQFDLINPGIFLIALPLLIGMLSLTGGLTGQGFFYMDNVTGFTFLDNYWLFIFTSMLAGAYFLSFTRRGFT